MALHHAKDILRASTPLAIALMLWAAPVSHAQKAGKHEGEKKQLDVSVEFFGAYGTTATNDQGTFYNYWGQTRYENKIYQPEYWGEFPLYFFGTNVGCLVHITNHGPRNRIKLSITTEAHVLHTDGTTGVTLKHPETVDVIVERGETVTVDASFLAGYVEGAESGLDRYLVKVAHTHSGDGPGNAEPALVCVKEAVFCPPDPIEE